MSTSGSFEDILSLAGDAGRWQWIIFFVASLSGFFNAFHHLGYVFLGAIPDHWCAVPLTNWTDENVKKCAIPRQQNGDGYSQCQMYDLNYTAIASNFSLCNVPDTAAKISCESYHYDDSQYTSTIVTQWNLVCERRALGSTVQATYMAGVFVGCFVFGTASDRFGRRPTYLTSATLFILVGLGTSLSVHYIMFIILRFILAMSAAGLFTPTFVLVTEITAPNLRTMMGIFFQIPFAVGYMVLSGVAYFIRDWKYLQISIAAPSIILISYVWLLPESPRWLATKGRFDEALHILKKAAKINRRDLPPDDDVKLMMKVFKENESSKQQQQLQKYGIGIFFNLFRSPKIRQRTATMYFTWFVVAMVYYGLALNVKNLGTNQYFVSFLNAIVEIPAYVIVYFLIMNGGRRFGYCGTFLAGGIACLSILVIPSHQKWVITSMAIIGKFCVTATFAISYLFTAELFPTVVRNVAVSSSSMCGRIGSILAPYIVDMLKPYFSNIPMVVFGVLAVIAGLLALLLPETNEANLMETIEDVELADSALSKIPSQEMKVATVRQEPDASSLKNPQFSEDL